MNPNLNPEWGHCWKCGDKEGFSRLYSCSHIGDVNLCNQCAANEGFIRLPKKGASKRAAARFRQIIEEAKEFTRELAAKINAGRQDGK